MLAQISRRRFLINAQASERLMRTQRNDGECRAGRNNLWRNGGVEIINAEPAEAGDLGAIELIAKFGIALGHLAEERAGLETHRNGAQRSARGGWCRLREFRGQQLQNAGCAQSRVTGKRQFLLRREDAHAHAFLSFDSGIAPLNECGLGQIEFARDCLHALCGRAHSVEDDGETVALESRLR